MYVYIVLFNNYIYIGSLLGAFLVVLWVSIFSSPGVMGVALLMLLLNSKTSPGHRLHDTQVL